VELRRLYSYYETWVALLKVDINFCLIFVLMGWFFFFSTEETFINMIFIFVTFAWAFVGHIGVRLEDTRMTTIFFIFSPVFPANIIWKLYSIKQDSETVPDIPLTQIIFVGVVALIIRVMLIFATIRMVTNFGQNLRDLVFDPEEEEEPTISVVAQQQIKPYLTLTVRKISQLNIFAGLSDSKYKTRETRTESEANPRDTIAPEYNENPKQ